MIIVLSNSATTMVTETPAIASLDVALTDVEDDPPSEQLYLPLTGRIIMTPDLQRVTESPLREIQPTLSPDNRKVAYLVVDVNGGIDIFVTDLVSGATTRLTNSPAIQEDTPVFTPNGTALAFGRNAGDGWDIYLIDSDGANARPLITHVGSDEMHPAFSPDGSTLYFSSNRAGGNWDIYSGSVQGGDWRNLTNSSAIERFPTVGFGGAFVIYRAEVGGNSDLYRKSINGVESPIRLTTSSDFEGYPTATSAHQGIAYVTLSPESHVWQMNDAGGGAHAIWQDMDWRSWTPRLSYDGTLLVYAVSLAGSNEDIFLSPYRSPLQAVGEIMFDAPDCGWEGGVLALGWARMWQSTRNSVYWNWLQQWVDACYSSGKQVEHVNDLLWGYGALVVYERYASQHYIDIAQAAADFVTNRAPRASDGTLLHLGDAAWSDTLIMAVPFLLKMGSVSGDQRYSREAVVQMNLHSQHLQSEQDALYRHAWPASPTGVSGPAYWGRGNGWALIAAAEILRSLPEGTPGRAAVMTNFRRHADAMALHQDNSGLWPTVVDQPTYYLETSGSALAAAALIEGVANGWLDSARLSAVARRARDAVLHEIEPDGTIGDVSAPTGPMLDVDAYNMIPKDVLTRYGQAAALLMGAAEADAAAFP